MSMNPNNPFEGGQEADPFSQGPPPKKGSNTWLWVLGIVGGVGLICVIGCCGIGYALFNFGTGMLAEAFKPQLQGNPVIEEHIGNIENLEMNFTRTVEEGENSNGEAIAFDVEGSKGSGTLMIKQDKSGDGTRIESAELVLPDGSRHAIELQGGSRGPGDGLDLDLGDVDMGEVDLGEVELGDVDAALEEIEKSLPPE